MLTICEEQQPNCKFHGEACHREITAEIQLRKMEVVLGLHNLVDSSLLHRMTQFVELYVRLVMVSEVIIGNAVKIGS